MKIAVIGAGLGGLAVSCLMAADGHNVKVYERNETVGGKMNRVESDGFRFDTGPSLLTMPDLLSDIFSRCGKQVLEYLDIEPLDPLCRYFYPDGTIFDNYQGSRKTLSEIKRFAPEDDEAYQNFLDYSQNLYRKTETSFLKNPLYSLSDLSEINLLDFLEIDAFSTQSETIDRHFRSDYLRKFFKRFATYNGSSPYQAPATLNVIPHVEITLGGYYVSGGIYQIVRAFRKLGEQLGVSYETNSDIERIRTEGGRAAGVTLSNGSRIDSDIVISNSDAGETYLNLLERSDTSPVKRAMVRKSEPSCSGFVLMLGIGRTYGQLKHHNVFFSEDYRSEFESIFGEKQPPDDPTIYIANTSHTEPGHAVRGGSNLFILVNVPYLSSHFNWEENKEKYAQLIIRKLENRGLEGLSDTIRFRQVITPVDFYENYLSNKGSIYGTSSNSRLSAFLRPRNKSRNVDGLYLVGGSTHPGGGIPLVLLSALNAIELIRRYE